MSRCLPCTLTRGPWASPTRVGHLRSALRMLPRQPGAHAASAVHRRRYASQTHRSTQGASSLLSQALDQKQRTARRDGRESVGPFPLGLARPTFDDGEKVKKWAELSTGGKMARATARTTNLTVILIGAGLSVVLIYALTSELFSKNSPTVIYGEACEKIKASPRIARYLHSPFMFHNNPPSAVRPRHRNQHVAHQFAIDSSGREHMFLTFYVQGSDPSSPSSLGGDDADAGYFPALQARAEELAQMSWDDVYGAASERTTNTLEAIKGAVRYLIGEPVRPQPTTQPGGQAAESVENQEEKSSIWSFAGVFSGLRTGLRKEREASRPPDGATWTEGEVHAELIRNDDGYYVFRYLLVDIPNSTSRHPIRVFVERAPGVTEYEPVMRWRS